MVLISELKNFWTFGPTSFPSTVAPTAYWYSIGNCFQNYWVLVPSCSTFIFFPKNYIGMYFASGQAWGLKSDIYTGQYPISRNTPCSNIWNTLMTRHRGYLWFMKKFYWNLKKCLICIRHLRPWGGESRRTTVLGDESLPPVRVVVTAKMLGLKQYRDFP